MTAGASERLARTLGRMPKKRVGQGKGGGPKTETGKENSSKNSTKHGLCASKAVILPGEKAEDHEEIQRGWREEYQPEGHAENTLVDEVISNQWALKRAKERVMWAEEAATNDWTEEAAHRLELMHRYHTKAERSFYRAWNAVQSLRKDRIKMFEKEHKTEERLRGHDSRISKLEKEKEPSAGACDLTKKNPYGPFANNQAHGKAAEKTRAQILFQGQLSPKKLKAKRAKTLEQWVEIAVEDGKTVTKLYPSNEELIKKGQKMWPAPDLIYRRLSFANGVPDEYAWTTVDAVTRERGGMGIQRMSVDTWLDVMEREQATATGHVGPTGVGNLPRPMSRGGCDCEVCAGNRELLAKMGVVV